MNSWTIPADPGLQTRHPNTDVAREADIKPLKPRIRPEAMMNAIKNQGTIAQLFNPCLKPPTLRASSRSGKHESKRDFVKENSRQIKNIQRSNRLYESEREPFKVAHKSEKSKDVKSKDKSIEVWDTPHAPRTRAPRMQVCRRSRSASPSVSRVTSTKPSTPHANAHENKLETEIPKEKSKVAKVNHISKNIRQITSSPVLRRRPPSAVAIEELERKRAENEKKYKRGEVPSYLRKRQEQWRTDEEERIKNIPDPSIPPGHTLMPRNERLQTLDLLKKKQQEWTIELNSLPVSCDTLRIKQRKVEIEAKLREIENALKVFSRPKVFVKIDS